MPASRDDSPWQDHPPDAPDRDDLLAPRTQIVADRETYLGQGRHDVGRRISNDQVELFASTDIASALQLEFTQHDPSFIALHDIGASASLRLLTSLAGAMERRLQRLTVRRQGHGMVMATLQFLELPLADGSPVRVYATDVAEDAATRAAVARVLLANSRLGVLLMGSVAQPALAMQLQPLNDAVQSGPWMNRELLMVPLGGGVPLAAPAAQLAGRSGVAVHVTPQAGKTRQAWSYIAGAWNRLHGGVGGAHVMRTEFDLAPTTPAPTPTPPPAAAPAVPRGEAVTERMALETLPAPLRGPPPAAAPAPAPFNTPGKPWQRYVDSCALLKGVVACCAFDTQSAYELARGGQGEHASARVPLAEHGTRLLRAMTEAARALGLGAPPSDGTVSAGSHHLIVRAVPGHPNVALHLVLSSSTNLTLAKMQLDRIAPPPAVH